MLQNEQDDETDGFLLRSVTQVVVTIFDEELWAEVGRLIHTSEKVAVLPKKEFVSVAQKIVERSEWCPLLLEYYLARERTTPGREQLHHRGYLVVAKVVPCPNESSIQEAMEV